MQFSIDGHNLTVISMDGYDIEPYEVEVLVSNSGIYRTILFYINKKSKNLNKIQNLYQNID
jgi:hypothetical protein